MKPIVCVIMALIIFASQALPDAQASNARLELIYERYDRDVELVKGQFSATGPGGVVPFVLPDRSGSQKEDRLMARMHFSFAHRLTVYLDAGMTDADQSEELVPIYGGGIGSLVYEGKYFDAAVFGFGRVVPNIVYKEKILDPALGAIESTQEESYWEAGVGLEFYRFFPFKKRGGLTAYSGVVFSMLRGDADFTDWYTDLGVSVKGTGELEEDGIVHLFGGLALLFSPRLSLRIEGHFINQSRLLFGLSLRL